MDSCLAIVVFDGSLLIGGRATGIALLFAAATSPRAVAPASPVPAPKRAADGMAVVRVPSLGLEVMGAPGALGTGMVPKSSYSRF